MITTGRLSRVQHAPKEDREQFIRDNAVSLMEARDRKIDRLIRRVRYLERSQASLKLENLRLRTQGLR